MASLAGVMAELEAAGSEKARKTYARHGAQEPIFGVSFADLGIMARGIKIDHPLAVALWDTRNHDARQLAAKIADPAQATTKLANQWARDCDSYMAVDAVVGMLGRSVHARALSDQWRDSQGEWVASLGWALAGFTAEDTDAWSAADLSALLVQIEAEIHTRPNRVRHEMNQALIMIALRDGELRRQAVATAHRVAPVMVDHRDTGCTTPEPTAYIERIFAHREKMAARRAVKDTG